MYGSTNRHSVTKYCKCSDNHGIPCLLQNLKVHYHVNKMFKREKLCDLQYLLHPLSHVQLFYSVPLSQAPSSYVLS